MHGQPSYSHANTLFNSASSAATQHTETATSEEAKLSTHRQASTKCAWITGTEDQQPLGANQGSRTISDWLEYAFLQAKSVEFQTFLAELVLRDTCLVLSPTSCTWSPTLIDCFFLSSVGLRRFLHQAVTDWP